MTYLYLYRNIVISCREKNLRNIQVLNTAKILGYKNYILLCYPLFYNIDIFFYCLRNLFYRHSHFYKIL